MKRLDSTIPGHIAQRVATLRMIDDALRDCLPAECCAHCRAGGLADGVLHLVTDSPAWRARLHFYSRRIISHFSRLGKSSVSSVKVRVAPAVAPPARRKAPGPPRSIPPDTARALTSLAAETGDDALRRVLERLARHSRRG